MSEWIFEMAYRTGLALLELLWQGSVIGLVVLLISRLFRDAAIRHLVNMTGLLLIGVCFVVSLLHTGGRTAALALTAPVPVIQLPAGNIAAEEQVPIVQYTQSTPEFVDIEKTEVAEATGREVWISLCAFGWIVGVLLLSMSQCLGVLRIRSLRNKGRSEPPAFLLQASAVVKKKLGIAKKVPIYVSEKVFTPLLIGLRRPVILMPLSAVSGLSEEEISAVLAHELAHLRRGDHWSNALQNMLETLLFYHPLVWVMSRQIRSDREIAADDCALTTGANPRDLARALASVALMQPPRPAVAASGGPLLYRIKRLTRIDAQPAPAKAEMATVSGVFALATGLLFAALFLPQLAAQNEETILVAPGEDLQAAIDDAKNGSVIQLEEGLYPGRIEISKPLTIRGVAWNKTSILPPLEDDGLYLQTVKIQIANGVVLENVRISPHENPANSGGRLYRDYAVSLTDGATAKFQSCAVVGPGSSGVLVEKGAELEMEKSLVVAFHGTGIAVWGKMDEDKPGRLLLKDSVVRNCNHRGITLGSGCDTSVIERNWISGSAWHGIRYDSASPRIERNVIFNHVRSGIYASGRTAATVTRNLFARNEMSGISCWYSNQDKIVGNIFVENKREALGVLGASKPVVQDNWFIDEEIGVRYGGIQGSGEFTESAGPPVMKGNLLVNVEKSLFSVEEEPLPDGNEIVDKDSMEERRDRLPDFGPAQTEEQFEIYTSEEGPVSWLERNPWTEILPEENRFWLSSTKTKKEATPEPSEQDIRDLRAAAQKWVSDAFQLNDPDVRDAAVEKIRAALQSDDANEVRKGFLAFNRLGAIRFDKASFHDIVSSKLDADEIFIRNQAVTALGMCGLKDGDLDRLIAMVDDPSDTIRKSVAGQIIGGVEKRLTGRAGNAILKLLNHKDYRFRKTILNYMWGGKYSRQLEKRILELSRQNEDSYNVLYYALSTQANKSRASVERLIEYLPDSDTTNVGHRAAWGLAQGVSESEYNLVANSALKLVEGRTGNLYRDGMNLLRKYAGEEQRETIEKLLANPAVEGDMEKQLQEVLEGLK
ncbi:MAG: M56 family metallopeptidase [Verrucomicrobiales bacterium]|nr:M56 family metallopeptidase [Verrucomicrobiales bacterium]